MKPWVKGLVAFLIAVELVGLGLIIFEAGLLFGERDSLHWVGYLGTGLMAAGALFFGKIYVPFIKG